MADAKQGQVDWGALADKLGDAGASACFDGLAIERELRTTFEPLVKAAEAALPWLYVTSENEQHRALRAALDALPKVGGG